MEPLNRLALELVDEALDFAAELEIGATELENGATVLDFGVDHPGGVEAGLLLTEIASSGLATVQTRMGRVGGRPLTTVEVATDQPDLALLGAMRAGWELTVDGYEGLAGGPARALVAEETVYERLGYGESAEFAVLTVESDERPGPAVAKAVAERTGLKPSDVFLVVYPAASIAGSVLAAARCAELTCGRLLDVDYDPRAIQSIVASAPTPPVAATEHDAVARAMDAVAYGGEVHCTVANGGDFAAVVSSAAERYGEPFAAIFESVEWHYERVDIEAFGPAALTVDVDGGPTVSHGEVAEEILVESFAF